MRFRRLGWTGIEIECEGEVLLLDYIQDTEPLPLSPQAGPFPPCSRPGDTAVALLTHLHADHADPLALEQALRSGAPIYRPLPASGAPGDLELTARAEAAFVKSALSATIVEPWQDVVAGPFRMTPVPAVDGFGDPQVSWVVECAGKRIIHAGDTLFHGFWWRIANRFPSFDIAFLPINAPVVEFPFLQPPNPREAVMTPEDAAVAAHLLRAPVIVPVHYHDLNHPPAYRETPNPVDRLRAAAAALGIEAAPMRPGEWQVL